MSSDGITIESGLPAPPEAPLEVYRGESELALPELGETVEPEVAPEEKAEEDVGVEPETEPAPAVEDERLQRIIEQLAKEQKRQAPPPQYDPHPALRRDYLKEKYGEALGEDNFDALVEMANEIAYAHQEYYHNTEVKPYIARLMQSHETTQEEAAIQRLQAKYGDVDQYLPQMAKIIESDQDMKRMPPDKRVRFAYLEAVSEKLPEVIKKAEQHGRNNQLKEMKQTFHTPASSGGRSSMRDNVQQIPPELARMCKAMGVDPIKAMKQPSKFSKGGR